MAEKITLRQLRARLRDVEVDEQELRPYVVLDEGRSQAFGPALCANLDTVDDEGHEGDIFLGIFNGLSRRRRQRRYRRKIEGGFQGVRIVSEGDSWFQYPILLDDVVDRLFDDYAILSLGAAGDLLADMINEDELTEAIEREQPDIFLISGGGNDLVGNSRLATMLHPFEAERKPEDYPNDRFDGHCTTKLWPRTEW